MKKIEEMKQKRIKLLGRVLSELGNFKGFKPKAIVTSDNKKVILIDKEKNQFGYYRFNNEDPYNEANYYLFMKKANSNVEHHYKLVDGQEQSKELVKVSYYLGKKQNKKREITIDLEKKQIATIRVTENEKEYLIHLSRYTAEKLLNNFEEIGSTLSKYNFLNLERILKAINCTQRIYKCMVLKDSKIQARLSLAGGLVKEYAINDSVRNEQIMEYSETLPKIKFTKEEPIVDTIDNSKQPHKYQLKKLLRWL